MIFTVSMISIPVTITLYTVHDLLSMSKSLSLFWFASQYILNAFIYLNDSKLCVTILNLLCLISKKTPSFLTVCYVCGFKACKLLVDI